MSVGHPSDDTLEAFAAGDLKAGARLTVAAHLERCPRCDGRVAVLEAVGGALLEAGEAEPMSQGALSSVLERLDAPPPKRPRLEAVLAGGVWLPVAPGVSLKLLSRFADPGERFYLIRAKSGAALPEHGHNGAERLTVLSGAFEDDTGRHDAGELVESWPGQTHTPVACQGEVCICLAATDGPLRLTGIARLIQPLLGL